MGQAKVEHTGEYKLTADNGHGTDEVRICATLNFSFVLRKKNYIFVGFQYEFLDCLFLVDQIFDIFTSQVNFIIDVEVPPDPPGQPEVIINQNYHYFTFRLL